MCTKEGILALKAAANEAGVMFKTTIESPEEEMKKLKEEVAKLKEENMILILENMALKGEIPATSEEDNEEDMASDAASDTTEHTAILGMPNNEVIDKFFA